LEYCYKSAYYYQYLASLLSAALHFCHISHFPNP
jgi:hypothetical protein